MKPFIFLLWLSFILVSCSEEQPINKGSSEIKQHANANSGARISASGEYSFHDWSGQIEILTQFANDGIDRQINHVQHQLPSDFVLIGGGATTSNVLAGALLTESRPDWANNTWVVSSKSHIDSDPHILTVYAVGIKIAGVSAESLRSVMTYKVSDASSSSSSQSKPWAYAQINSPFILIGGGAKVNNPDADWGNMLVYSYPSGQGWFVGSKDHINADPATITAYAIGIQDFIPGFGYIDVNMLQDDRTVSNGTNTLSYNLADNNGYVNASVGALEDYNPAGWGRMLTQMRPWERIPNTNTASAFVESKAHKKICSGTLHIYLKMIRKRP